MTQIFGIVSSQLNFFIFYADEFHILSTVVEEKKGYNSQLLCVFGTFIKKNNIHIDLLDFITISADPSSYTGIRILYSFIFGLTLGSKTKIIELDLLKIYLDYVRIFYTNKLKDICVCTFITTKNDNIYTLTEFNNRQILYGKYNVEIIKNNLKKYNKAILISESNSVVQGNNSEIIKVDNEKLFLNAMYNVTLEKIKNKDFLNVDDLEIIYY